LAGYGLGTLIRATLARILIPGPDTDPLLRIWSGCLPKSTDLLDYLRTFFTDFYGLDWYLQRYARVCGLKGGTASKILIKTRKIVGSSVLLLDCAQVFTRVEGGIGGPNLPYGTLGSLENHHGTSFIKFNFNPRVCFLRLLFTQLVRAVVRKTDFKRG
jgi:hypothetical protein